ncbi:helix-turn-helix domain-containing protein [candidate division KSB1 bacterium]|nr:helix-turn-helix domain-containing protein [candidate division KSB1 bacterium]
MNSKSYTLERKLEILEAVKTSSIPKVAKKLNICPASIYNWKKQHETFGEDGLKDGRSGNRIYTIFTPVLIILRPLARSKRLIKRSKKNWFERRHFQV